MARGDQLLLQREGSDRIALVPEIFGVLLTAEGLLFRCASPNQRRDASCSLVRMQAS